MYMKQLSAAASVLLCNRLSYTTGSVIQQHQTNEDRKNSVETSFSELKSPTGCKSVDSAEYPNNSHEHVELVDISVQVY